jgi:hypothetical protein
MPDRTENEGAAKMHTYGPEQLGLRLMSSKELNWLLCRPLKEVRPLPTGAAAGKVYS